MEKAGERLTTLAARFEQTNYDYVLGEEETISGQLFVKVPGRIRWEYVPPRPKVLLVRDDKVLLYNPVAHQVQEFDRRKMKGAGADLLVGFGRSNAEIAKNYDPRLVEETGTTVVLELIPKPGTAPSVFTAIELSVDKQRWIPVRSVFHEPNRDTTTIDFLQVQINGVLPERIFELELPPDVEFIREN